MKGYSSIYCEGSSLDVSAGAAEVLRRKGLIVRHPGAGADGITGGDWTLAEAVAWDHVYEFVDEGTGNLNDAGAEAAGHLPRRGLFDLRRDLGRAPTAQEWAEECGR